MARAPPADDAEPEIIEFGIPVLDDRLEEVDLTFPADRAELEATIGSVEVPYDASGHTLRLGDALEALEADRFESRNELLEALHPVFEAHRARTPTGVVGRLRALLPF